MCSGTRRACSATPRTSGTCTTPVGGECNESADCACPPGRADCGGTCVDRSTDAANCGACGNRCTASQRCASGACVQLMCPSEMALIPAGSFDMGAMDLPDSSPVHRVTLSAFCMDVTEVTVAAYRMCMSTGCTSPGTGGFCNWNVSGRDNHPINCVDWNQARAYCQWRGGDLPTEAQWEYAARGTDGRTYPWGNTAPSNQLCWRGELSCAVRTSPSGVSPFGLQDMAGNVWEWVRDWRGSYTDTASTDPTGPPSGDDHVGRGGSWDDTDAVRVRAAFRYSFSPSYRGGFLGFRCARGPS